MADRNSIIEKIKALLAKTTANGATEAEMLSALDKASAMMDAYDITDADVQIAKDEAAMLHADPPDLKDPHKIKWQSLLRRRAILRRADFSLASSNRSQVHRHAERRAVRYVAARQPRRLCIRRIVRAPDRVPRTARVSAGSLYDPSPRPAANASSTGCSRWSSDQKQRVPATAVSWSSSRTRPSKLSWRSAASTCARAVDTRHRLLTQQRKQRAVLQATARRLADR